MATPSPRPSSPGSPHRRTRVTRIREPYDTDADAGTGADLTLEFDPTDPAEDVPEDETTLAPAGGGGDRHALATPHTPTPAPLAPARLSLFGPPDDDDLPSNLPTALPGLLAGVGPGKDEMNLAEFPFAVLSRRTARDQKTITVIQEGRDAAGRRFKSEWIVTGSDYYGLPTAGDEDVYVALMKLLRDNQFKSRTVGFSVAQLLRIMGWGTSAKDYKRVEDALNRLSGVLLHSDRAFWDHAKKRHVTEAFHLLEGYSLAGRSGSGRRSARGQGGELSFATFSEFLFSSIQAGYVKNLDVEFYFALESSLGRRLYRLLDKRRWRSPLCEIELKRLAQKLPLADKYDSQIRRRLQPVLDELVAKRYLTRAAFVPGPPGAGALLAVRFASVPALEALEAEETTAPPALLPAPIEHSERLANAPAPRMPLEAPESPGEAALPPKTIVDPSRGANAPENAIFAPAAPPPTETGSPSSGGASGGGEGTAPGDLVERLRTAGVSKRTAEDLAVRCPADEIERQLAYLPFAEGIKNPGGYLRQAIEGGFGPPPAYLAKQETERKEREKAERRRRRAESPAPDPQHPTPAAPAAEALEAATAALEAADPDLYARLVALAEEQIPPPIRRHPTSPAFKAVRDARLADLIRRYKETGRAE
jgi:plasmid replication initiation protein